MTARPSLQQQLMQVTTALFLTSFLCRTTAIRNILKAYPDAFTDLKDMDINWDDFGALKQSYSMVDDTHYGVPFDNGAVIACYRTDILEEAGYTLDDLTDITWSRFDGNR